MKKDIDITENKTENQEVAKSKKEKSKRIRNQLLFKKGGVSLAITALFIAVVVVLNVLFGILSDRIALEYDFSNDKVNSLSKQNIEYVKKVNKEVKIIFCDTEDGYAENLISFFSMGGYAFDSKASDYFEQTVKLVKKYSAYNKNISLEFVDVFSNRYSELSETYKNKLSGASGDIIVSSAIGDNERVKVLTFPDIYSYEQAADMSYTITENKIENALTGAISYVVNTYDKKIGIMTGHSSVDYTEAYYAQMLKDNNYEVEIIEDKQITSIPNDLDEIVIAAPSEDFSEEEIAVIESFLVNNDKFGKGLSVFAKTGETNLVRFYDFLNSWGIKVEEGKLCNIDGNYNPKINPTAIYSTDSLQSPTLTATTELNVPLSAADESNGCEVSFDFQAYGENAIVPASAHIETETDISEYIDTDADTEENVYATVITSTKTPKVQTFDEETPESYISVFSSISFLQSTYNEEQGVDNKEIALQITERNCGIEQSDISFVTKTITNESFAGTVDKNSANRIRNWFVYIIPLAIIGLGIFVHVRRRNAK